MFKADLQIDLSLDSAEIDLRMGRIDYGLIHRIMAILFALGDSNADLCQQWSKYIGVIPNFSSLSATSSL